MIDGAPSCGGQAASYGGSAEGAGQLNETIITYLGNLSIPNYKWFRCYGIDDGKVETRNAKVETGRAERVKPPPFSKLTPKDSLLVCNVFSLWSGAENLSLF